MKSLVIRESFHDLPKALREEGLQSARILVVADSQVAELYLKELLFALNETDAEVFSMTIPAGEENKQLRVIEEIYRVLIRKGFDRHDMLIAFGGGVAGDMTGFAAATYLRGVRFVQVPTTLLADVDSSIGGKTGVDLDGFKNMIGAFHKPSLVYMNLSLLKSLPDEQFRSGLAEVIKTALIRDAALFHWLLAHHDDVKARNEEALSHMIRASLAVKSAIVEEDPTEQGIRAILNFGHTAGHAIEKLLAFALPHGQCVSIGMACALELSEQKGLLSSADRMQAMDCLEGYDLPLKAEGISADAVLDAMRRDKKMRAGKLRFICLDAIGSAVICEQGFDESLIEAVQTVCES